MMVSYQLAKEQKFEGQVNSDKQSKGKDKGNGCMYDIISDSAESQSDCFASDYAMSRNSESQKTASSEDSDEESQRGKM